MWNMEARNFICEFGISYVNIFLFQMWSKSFMCEDVSIPYVITSETTCEIFVGIIMMLHEKRFDDDI